GGWQQPLLSAAHGIRGPRRLALSHVDQVSTLRGRACMVTAGCLLASEQLVSISEHTRAISGPVAGVLKTKGKEGKCWRDRVRVAHVVGRTRERFAASGRRQLALKRSLAWGPASSRCKPATDCTGARDLLPDTGSRFFPAFVTGSASAAALLACPSTSQRACSRMRR